MRRSFQRRGIHGEKLAEKLQQPTNTVKSFRGEGAKKTKGADPRPDERRPRLFKFGGDRRYCSAWKLHDEGIHPVASKVRFLTAIFQRSYNSPRTMAARNAKLIYHWAVKTRFKTLQ